MTELASESEIKEKTLILFFLYNNPSGKYKYSGKVLVEGEFWEEGFLSKLIISQKEVVESAFDHNQYFMITRTPDDYKGKKFYEKLWMPWELQDAFLKRSNYETY